MDDETHHQRLIAALKRRWQNVGGPVSLTAFLRECRPTIAELRVKGVGWDWLGPRRL